MFLLSGVYAGVIIHFIFISFHLPAAASGCSCWAAVKGIYRTHRVCLKPNLVGHISQVAAKNAAMQSDLLAFRQGLSKASAKVGARSGWLSGIVLATTGKLSRSAEGQSQA